MNIRRELVAVVALVMAGCAGPAINGVRVVDDAGRPVAGATVRLTYAVPHTLAVQEAGPTDAAGYANVGRHRLRKESHATVLTETEVVSFTGSQLGELRDGVVTLSFWRGSRDRSAGAASEGEGLHVPSIFLLRGED